MRGTRGILQQNDSGLVVAAVVEGSRVDAQRLAAVSAITDHAPGRYDALSTRKPNNRGARFDFFSGWLIRIAQRQAFGFIAPEGSLVHVAATAPVPCRAVVVMKLNHDVMTGSIAESHGPERGLSRLGSGAGAGREVFVSILGACRACQEKGEHRKHRADGSHVHQQRAPLTATLIFL